MLELKSLKVFLTVAELASMTAAARRLNLSQSAVSQAIRQLEDSIGAVLIDRDRRPLALTAAGAALRERGSTLVAEAESLYKTVREQAGGEAQMLRIGMVDSFAATIGPSLVKWLWNAAVHLHVASGLSPGLNDGLVERRLDMIVTTDPPDVAALERHRLLTERYVIAMPRALVTGDSAPTLASLARTTPLVRFNADSHIGLCIERHLAEAGLTPPRRLEIDTADSVVAMVAAGLGWALITPLCLLQARADPGAIAVLPLEGKALQRDLVLVSRSGEYGELPKSIAATAVSIFATAWRPELARLAPWLADAVSISV